MQKTRIEVLRGTLQDDSPLAALRGQALVLSEIFKHYDAELCAEHVESSTQSFKIIGRLPFPAPRGRCVNMMPVDLWHLESTLPADLHDYIPLIRACPVLLYSFDDFDANGFRVKERKQRIVYLTVHETETVPAGTTQRRSGLHIERPGSSRITNGWLCNREADPSKHRELCWGLGCCISKDGNTDMPVDGIYMASTVAGSSAVYSALIKEPEAVTDAHGALPEVMRTHLGEPYTLNARELCWMTDRTPHEALPQPSTGPRQFFRLVAGPISVWYSRHNTPNPLGVQPEAPISDEDKFA